MKTYLLDSYNRFKRYSEILDVKTKLCNRPWVVFNDGGEREVYKFKEDGKLQIILSGVVTLGTWEYDPTDKTLIISVPGQSFMVHPGIYEDTLLGLQVDGTNQCAFLIEENNANYFAPKTYSELIGYFEQKERTRLEEERRVQLQLQQAAEEKQKKQEEKLHIEKVQKDFDEYMSLFTSDSKYKKLFKKTSSSDTVCVLSCLVYILILVAGVYIIMNYLHGLIIFITMFLMILIWIITTVKISDRCERNNEAFYEYVDSLKANYFKTHHISTADKQIINDYCDRKYKSRY